VDADVHAGILPPLFCAILCGHVKAVEACLQAGADVTTATSEGVLLLNCAVGSGNLEIVTCLLMAGAEINKADSEGIFPLYSAAASGDPEMATCLLRAGADINSLTSNGFSPLHSAANSGNLQMVEFLLSTGADINTTNSDGISPLHYAAASQHLDIIACLLQDEAAQASLDLEESDIYASPFITGAQTGNLDVQLFLDVGRLEGSKADLISLAFVEAAQSGNIVTLRALLELGADPLSRSSAGITAVHSVTESNGGAEIVEYLISLGIDINAVDEGNSTALVYAAKADSTETVRALLKAGAVVDIPDSAGFTVLLYAAESTKENSAQIATALLDAQANIEVAVQGWTPLHFFVSCDNENVLDVLLKFGANVSARTDDDEIDYNLMTSLAFRWRKEA
jgi:ankyrin repeat protein